MHLVFHINLAEFVMNNFEVKIEATIIQHLEKGHKVMWRILLPDQPETPGGALLFMISVGSFMCITQHPGPTAVHPIQRTRQL